MDHVITETLTEAWQIDALENIFGEEELSAVRRSWDPDEEYELIVTVSRGKKK